MLYLDTETVGLTGPVVLIQYGTSKEDKKLYYVWEHTVQETLDLIKSFLVHDTWCLFNASFDSFHLNKLYNTFLLVEDKNLKPDPKEIFSLEKGYYHSNICIKPKKCYDIMILLKRHLLQFLMVRREKPLNIRKVPKQSVSFLMSHLEAFSSKMHPLLFAHGNQRDCWRIEDSKDRKGNTIPGFVDISIRFAPSTALKPIVKYILGKSVQSIEIPPQYMPADEKEQGRKSKEYRPYNFTWPDVLDYHLRYWHTRQGMQYANDDIDHLVDLRELINKKDHTCSECNNDITPTIKCKNCGHLNTIHWSPNYDQDSDLAWMIGQVRSVGFPIDTELLEDCLAAAKANANLIPTAPRQALFYLRSSKDWLDEYDLMIRDTGVKTLEFIISKEWGEVSQRAKEIKEQRELEKQIDLLEKLYEVQRVHPNLNASGTKSNRMSGTGGLNFQGINRESDFRRLFTFNNSSQYVLSGGDFDGQEVTILDARVNDPQLRADLKEHGSIHLLMWRILYNEPEAKLSEIKKDKERYTRCKNTVFAWFYGAEDEKTAETAKISVERAAEVREAWFERYPNYRKFRESITKNYVSMHQPGGIGTAISYRSPKPYSESLFGYRRYFQLENGWVEFLVNLAQYMPDFDGGFTQVKRTDRMQSAKGALQSALYGAAFGTQSSNLRQAGNHEIQSTGAEVTKRVQWNVWQLQPVGIVDFVVKPLNIHDEILCVNNCPEKVSSVVYSTVEELRKTIPLLSIDWKDDIENWSER